MLDRATSAGTDFSLTIHRGMPQDWPGVRSMGAARGHIFQTAEFMSIWAETYAISMQLDARFVDVHDRDGAMVLRLPLAIETRRGLKVLSFADQGCADYNAPLLFPVAHAWTAETARALWQAIERALPPVDLVELEKMPAMVGDCVNPLFLLSDTANPEFCHGSDVTRPWAEIEQTQAQLKTLKRKARGLEKLGRVRFFVAKDAAERQRLLTRLLAQKQRRYEDTQVPGFEEQADQKRFFELATDLFAKTGDLHLAGLEVGDDVVATSWTVSLGKTVYELMIGFEAGEMTKHSGGRVLNLNFLEWAKGAGFDYVDHGIGDEAWKHENCDTHVPLRRLIVPRTGKGRRALARVALVARLRETPLYKRLRPYKWIVKRALRRT